MRLLTPAEILARIWGLESNSVEVEVRFGTAEEHIGVLKDILVRKGQPYPEYENTGFGD